MKSIFSKIYSFLLHTFLKIQSLTKDAKSRVASRGSSDKEQE